MAQPDTLHLYAVPQAATAEIRPFQVNFPEEQLADLRRRIAATQWPERETVNDATQGVQLVTMQKLAQYWATDYDWRKCEASLNALPQFVTRIDGLDIHFIHVRSKNKNALPIIITHGWPGSIIEQLKVIGPLTDPVAYGGEVKDSFDVVIPSLPGYGFSGKPMAPGWNPPRIARAWATLMQRLGYTRYVAQGGDWGNAVTEFMAVQEPPGLLGIHTNMPATVPANVSQALAFQQAPPADLTPEERRAWDQLDFFYKNGLGYAIEMNNRPQTLYGIVDSSHRVGGLDDRPRRAQRGNDRSRFRRQDGRTDTGRRAGQHHTLLADEHRDLLGSTLLGQRTPSDRGLLRPTWHQDPGCGERLSRRTLLGTAELGGERVSQTDLLQPTPERRALCGLGTAGTVQ